ncbi:MAG: hypothetical protein K2G80_09125 [Bacteroidales bacterium]|nr:hypothetical protein [Bacteroidales bacterium]
MKNIKDVENMSMEALESIAEDRSIEIPGTLRERLLRNAAAAAIVEEEKAVGQTGTRNGLYAKFAIAAAAAACLTIFLTVQGQPEDTFDDPLMAYAELERTFSYISSKMDKGLEIASEAEPVFEKTATVISRGIKKN